MWSPEGRGKLILRILWLSHVVPYPPHGGVLQRSYHLLRQLASHYRVGLWAIVQPAWLEVTHGDVESGLSAARTELGAMCESVEFARLPGLEHPGSLAKAASFLRPGGYTANWLWEHRAAEQLTRFAEGRRFDALHVDTISLHPYRKLLARVPATLTHHNIESQMMARRADMAELPIQKLLYSIEAGRLARYERNALASYETHIVCSALDAERLTRSCGEATTAVVPNAVDIDYFAPRPIDESTISLVFAGNMSWYPNRDAMLHFANDIWPVIRSRVPNVVMHLAGAHAPDELVRLAERDDRFRVLGYVDDVRKAIADATVYVCPIRDGGGTKLKILDALAMGKAIVAYPVACEGIEVEDGRNVMLADDAEGFTSAVESLIADRANRQSLQRQARDLACDKYSVDQVGRRLADVYESVARARGSDQAGDP